MHIGEIEDKSFVIYALAHWKDFHNDFSNKDENIHGIQFSAIAQNGQIYRFEY